MSHKKPVAVFKPDDASEITCWDYQSNGAINAVLIRLDGFHGTFQNKVSTKNYIVTKGFVTFEVEGKKTVVNEGELFFILPDQKHSMKGQNAEMVIICDPPFDPADEGAV